MPHCPPRRPIALCQLTLALVFSFPLLAISKDFAAQDPSTPVRLAQDTSKPASVASGATAAAAAPAAPVAAAPPAASPATGTEPAVSSALLPNATTGEGLQASTPDEPHDGMGHLPGHAMPSQAADTEEDDDDPHHGMMHSHHIVVDDDGVENPHHGMMMHDPHHGMRAHESMEDGDHCSMGGHEGMMGPHHGDPHHGMVGAVMPLHHDGDEEADSLAIAAPAPPSWLEGLELSEDQEDKIFAILHEFAPAHRKAARLVAKDRSKLRHIGMATDYSETETRKLADEYGRALAEIGLQSAKMERRILDALTPEQRKDAAHQAARGMD